MTELTNTDTLISFHTTQKYLRHDFYKECQCQFLTNHSLIDFFYKLIIENLNINCTLQNKHIFIKFNTRNNTINMVTLHHVLRFNNDENKISLMAFLFSFVSKLSYGSCILST